MSQADFAQRSADSAGIIRYLTFVGLVFLALMLFLEPDVGFNAPFAIRVLFWTMQIVSGLFVLQTVLYLLTRRYGASRAPSWSLVLLSGLLGTTLLAPLYWLIGEGLIEKWLGYPARPDEETTELLSIALTDPFIQEYLDIVGPVTTAWALICLPRLHWLIPPLLQAATRNGVGSSKSETIPPAPRPSTEHDKTDGAEVSTPINSTWRQRLPAQLGTDVIAVASELQYLRVWTPRGCALILGALADVESSDAATGLRVHRSWWVATEHVVSVRRTATGAVCLMSDGHEVPVSRRRRSEVIARFGSGTQYRVDRPSESIANADLQ